MRRTGRVVCFAIAWITMALLVGLPATASDGGELKGGDVKSHKLLSSRTDAPGRVRRCIPRCPAELRPVPMPEVTPVSPGPVPIPRAEPAKPGPVPMPMFDRPGDSPRPLRGHTPRLPQGPGGL